MPTEKQQITIIGSGVIGLTLSYLLLKSKTYNVTIIAEHIPPSNDIEFTSSKAGAIWRSFADEFDQSHIDYDKITWQHLLKLTEQYPELKSIIKLVPVFEAFENSSEFHLPWFTGLAPNFKLLSNEELPKGLDKGFEYDTICINTPDYLLWLKNQFIQLGGKFIQKRLAKFEDALDLVKNTQLIVNCSGLGHSTLATDKDSDLIPIRGQTVLVKAPHLTKNMIIYPDGLEGQHEFYVILRGNGDVILGGVMQSGNWSKDYDFAVEKLVIEGCVKYHSELKIGEFEIIGRNVGFRPGRKSGIRIELDNLTNKDNQKLPMVHFYGHGGAGYQSSWGSSFRVLNLINSKLNTQSKL